MTIFDHLTCGKVCQLCTSRIPKQYLFLTHFNSYKLSSAVFLFEIIILTHVKNRTILNISGFLNQLFLLKCIVIIIRWCYWSETWAIFCLINDIKWNLYSINCDLKFRNFIYKSKEIQKQNITITCHTKFPSVTLFHQNSLLLESHMTLLPHSV